MSSRNWPRLRSSAGFTLGLAILCTLQNASAADDPHGRIPNTELITQDGKKVHFYDDLVKGRIVAIAFVYTTCQYACPLETARMAQVQKKLGDRVGSDIFFYSVSIDPEHDTPATLKAYMEKFHIGPGWTFLTGKKADIDLLQRKMGVYTDPSINPDGHLPHLLIGNDATNTWIRANAMDNPNFQARMIGEFLDNFKHTDFKAEQQKKTGDGSPIANFDRGRYLFQRDCAACHTVGQGDKIGPDLLGVTSKRDHDWLVRMIQQPDALLKSNDAVAKALLKKYNNVRMPNLWVSDDGIHVLLQYFADATAAHHKQASSANGAEGAAKPADPSGGTVRPNR
jgi:protein SCO1/2